MPLQILFSVILPIFALIGVGVVMDRCFKLDLPTLSKLNFYVFVPALCFAKLLEAHITARDLTTIGAFSLLHALVLLGLSWLIFSHRSLRDSRTVLTLCAIFYNCGNYGIPLTQLAFGSDAVGIIVIVIIVQTFLVFTLGIWMMEHKASGARTVLQGMAKSPVIYAVVLALLFRVLRVEVPAPVMAPIRYLSDGLISLALLTLGIQLSRTKLSRSFAPLTAVTAMRLLISPALAALLVIPFHFAPHIAPVLIVGAGFPIAVNVYIIAVEYRQGEDLTSQSIFVSTLVSAITMAGLIAWLK